jgi:hypothetical protein
VILTTFQFASDQIRRDTTDDDALLMLHLKAASRAIVNYLQGPGIDGFTDSAGDIIEDSNGDPLYVPEDVQLACVVLTAMYYRHRDENQDGIFERNFSMPAPVAALLTPYRVPSLA